MRFALCLCILVLYAGVQGDHHKGDYDHKNVTCHQIACVSAEFTFKLYQHVASDKGSSNIFISPVNIATAFAMLSLGAKAHTNIEIVETLGFNRTLLTDEEMHKSFQHLIQKLNEPNRDLQLDTGNAVFVARDLKILPKFMEDVHNYYESEAFTTDFSNTAKAIKQINDYVEKKTHGNIVDVMKKIDPRNVLVLVSYIYFQGTWEKFFDRNLTRDDDFNVDENTVVRVPMMVRSGMYEIYTDAELHCTVVRLPYKGNALAFLILPDEGKLKQVEDALAEATIRKWESKLRRTSVELHVPKFSLSTKLDLKETFMKMGMTKVFSDEADLSGITGLPNLKVSEAVHKAVINVDEAGTTAAVVTINEIMPMSLPYLIKFNSPFLMLVCYPNTKSNLFIARIANPTA
uniref:Alpha-1-antiproteinase-like n=1 Tax=Geotrypetes seraphini TaxID=260995 RepID=A0A6P8Q8U7_GEOSA|nr:alpha-1-antiproteinase-like [Geotrypetes seraphini]